LNFFSRDPIVKVETYRITKEKTYLAKTGNRRHLILVTLTKEHATYEAIDAYGVVFDRTVSTP